MDVERDSRESSVGGGLIIKHASETKDSGQHRCLTPKMFGGILSREAVLRWWSSCT